MSLTLRCIEPEHRPAVAELELEKPGTIAIWALVDEPSERLRRTVLREAGVAPPAGALLMMEVDLDQRRSGAAGLHLRRVGPELSIEWQRSDTRGTATTAAGLRGQDLRDGGRFEVTLADRRRLSFSLEVEAEVRASTRMAVAGTGGGRSQAVLHNRGALWVVPGIWSLVVDADDVVKSNLHALGKRFGLSTRSTVWMIAAAMAAASVGALWYSQYQAAQGAEAKADEATTVAAVAGATRDAALKGEQACIAERRSLSERLDERDAARKLRAEEALALTATRTAAIELGGPELGGQQVAPFDEARGAALLARVMQEMGRVSAASSQLDHCLSYSTLLDAGTPAYLLDWHPDPALSCPETYAVVLGEADLAGVWGLSTRIAREFASPGAAIGQDGAPEADPRFVDRWAAETLLRAFAGTRAALLTHPSRGRPVVTPAESGAWALAVLGAYTRMPSPGDGVLDLPLETCVGGWLDTLLDAAPPAGPGEPLLPELGKVASGDVTVPMTATPGCPWPPHAMQEGAVASLNAVARYAEFALVEDAP